MLISALKCSAALCSFSINVKIVPRSSSTLCSVSVASLSLYLEERILRDRRRKVERSSSKNAAEERIPWMIWPCNGQSPASQNELFFKAFFGNFRWKWLIAFLSKISVPRIMVSQSLVYSALFFPMVDNQVFLLAELPKRNMLVTFFILR